jgi:predicted RNase H-like HicB family nuclease
MTTETQSLSTWEACFFAGITLKAAEATAKEAKQVHERAAASYIASLDEQNRDKVIIARTNLSHSLKRYHATQRTVKNAKDEVARTHTITFAQ